MGEHRLCKPRVAGSIPVRSTSIYRQYLSEMTGRVSKASDVIFAPAEFAATRGKWDVDPVFDN